MRTSRRSLLKGGALAGAMAAVPVAVRAAEAAAVVVYDSRLAESARFGAGQGIDLAHLSLREAHSALAGAVHRSAASERISAGAEVAAPPPPPPPNQQRGAAPRLTRKPAHANINTNDAVRWERWENMIGPFLDKGYLCTLDIDVGCVEGLLESGLCESRNFIPMISVKLPYIRQLGYNATLKLDDKDFAATNPGVWCHSVHKLQSRTAFTDWSKYIKDETL